MPSESARLRQLAAHYKQLADDCRTTEPRQALLRLASKIDRKANIIEEFQGELDTVE